MVVTRRQTADTKQRTQSVINGYLFVYNAVSFVAWLYVLYSLVKILGFYNKGEFTLVFGRLNKIVTYVQTAAVLEIFHSLFKFVRSPVFTTLLQVTSRLGLVWLINTYIAYRGATTHWSYSVMVFAWSLTETVRYLYYALGLVNRLESTTIGRIVTWARYSLFWVLYPMGVFTGELPQIYLSLPAPIVVATPALMYGLWAIMAVYLPGFPVMFGHMVRQRRKVLGGAVAATTKKATKTPSKAKTPAAKTPAAKTPAAKTPAAKAPAAKKTPAAAKKSASKPRTKKE